MLSRLRQLAFKLESVEGTVESLAAADAKALVSDPKINFDPEMLEQNPVLSSFSKIASISGKRPGSGTFSMLLKGSGDKTVEPDWASHIKACGFEISVLKSIAIGAISSSTDFIHGEVITGGTSAGTGKVIKNTVNGASKIYYVVLTGTLQSGEVLTGGTSGATATTSGSPTIEGKVILPISESISSATMGTYENGIRKVLKGARGKLKFTGESGKPFTKAYEFMGVEAGITDLAMLTGITRQSTKPPAFYNASFSINGVSAKIKSIEIDIATVLGIRDDVNDQRGILSFVITDRKITGSFDPEKVLVATHDFWGIWFAGTEMELDFIVGATTGNKFNFYAPKAQYQKVEDESRDGIDIAKTAFSLNGHPDLANSEFCILAL